MMKQLRQWLDYVARPTCGWLVEHYAPRQLPVGLPSDLTEASSNGALPRISVVVPSFNQGEFIEATLRSIFDQQYPSLEVLVVDGGSSDETLDILSRFEARIHWWVSESDNGQAHAINKGMNRATGQLLCWLNSDDLLMPGALLRAGLAFLEKPDLDVVYGHRVLIDAQGRDVGRWILPAHDPILLTYSDYVPQETMIWRRDLWAAVGGLDESFQFALDWDLLCRFMDSGARFALLPFFMGQFRMHSGQKTQAEIASTGLQEMDRIRERYLACADNRSAVVRSRRRRHILFLLRARLTEIFCRLQLVEIR